jgi:hypothetical protein
MSLPPNVKPYEQPVPKEDPNVPKKYADPKVIVSNMNKVIKRSKDTYMQSLKQNNNALYHMKLEEEFPTFSLSYPSFFRKIADGLTFSDMEQIAKFLDALDSVRKGTESIKTVEEKLSEPLFKKYADKKLYDEYIAKKNIDKENKKS